MSDFILNKLINQVLPARPSIRVSVFLSVPIYSK